MSLSRQEIQKGLEERIVGQRPAIERLAAYLERVLARPHSPKEVLGSVVLAGSPGCGKTHLVRSVAQLILGSEEKLVEMDCALAEPHALADRFAAEAHREESRVRLVLLDNIDRASAPVLDTVEHILSYAMLEVGKEMQVSFQNTLFFLRYTLGADEAAVDAPVGFAAGKSREAARQVLSDLARKEIPARLLNVLEELIPLDALKHDELSGILDRHQRWLSARAEQAGVHLTMDPLVPPAILSRVASEWTTAARRITRLFRDDLSARLSTLPRGTRLRLTIIDGDIALTSS